MGDCLRTDKLYGYVTGHLDTAFYLPWDGKMSIGFQAEYR